MTSALSACVVGDVHDVVAAAGQAVSAPPLEKESSSTIMRHHHVEVGERFLVDGLAPLQCSLTSHEPY